MSWTEGRIDQLFGLLERFVAAHETAARAAFDSARSSRAIADATIATAEETKRLQKQLSKPDWSWDRPLDAGPDNAD